MITRSHSFKQMMFLDRVLTDLRHAKLVYDSSDGAVSVVYMMELRPDHCVQVVLDLQLLTPASIVCREIHEETWCSTFAVRFVYHPEDTPNIENVVFKRLKHEAPSEYMNLAVYAEKVLCEHARALEREGSDVHHDFGEWTPFYLACAMAERVPLTPWQVREVAYAAWRQHNSLVETFRTLMNLEVAKRHCYWGHWGLATLYFVEEEESDAPVE